MSMATESPHWLIMGKMVSPPFLGCFWSDPIVFILAGNEDMHKISDDFEFWPDRNTDYEVSCPWASKKFLVDLQWENGVSILALSFFIESSSKLLLIRTGIKGQVRFWAESDHSFWSYLPLSDENLTLLNLNISEASRPILIKFYV